MAKSFFIPAGMLCLSCIAIGAPMSFQLYSGTAGNGTFNFSNGAAVSFQGTADFNNQQLIACNSSSPGCAEGSTELISDGGNSSVMGNSVNGTVTLNGTAYPFNCNDSTTCNVTSFFAYYLTIPTTAVNSVQVTEPFTFSSTVTLVNPDLDVDFTGSGIATVQLLRSGSSDFVIGGVTYALTTPEPATAPLIALPCLVVLIARRRVRA